MYSALIIIIIIIAAAEEYDSISIAQAPRSSSTHMHRPYTFHGLGRGIVNVFHLRFFSPHWIATETVPVHTVHTDTHVKPMFHVTSPCTHVCAFYSKRSEERYIIWTCTMFCVCMHSTRLHHEYNMHKNASELPHTIMRSRVQANHLLVRSKKIETHTMMIERAHTRHAEDPPGHSLVRALRIYNSACPRILEQHAHIEEHLCGSESYMRGWSRSWILCPCVRLLLAFVCAPRS